MLKHLTAYTPPQSVACSRTWKAGVTSEADDGSSALERYECKTLMNSWVSPSAGEV